MIERHWDPKGRYLGAVLRATADWCLEVSFRQHTLGSYILFCRRIGVRLMSELTEIELITLRNEMRIIEEALRKNPAFEPDRFNYLQTGDNVPHLHFHGIPRYERSREFEGKEWIDAAWGHAPTWTREEISWKLRESLKAEMKKFLPP